ncbi:hypothetical protein AHAS_Ahas17G0265700 [Arachis hypogaea]
MPKCGNMEKARQVFYGMVERDIICWSVMIQGYASNELPKEALDLFFEMQRENLWPYCYAIVGVLSTCASITQAVDILRIMKGKDRVVFNAIISGLAMNGHVRATFGVFGQMEKYEIQPDGNNFVGLLCGCTHAVLLVEAHNLIKSMPMKLNTIVLRELLGGSSHRWDEAEKVRLTLNEKGMQKLPGCSWVEVDGVVHEYFVGDTFHPMSPKIYEKLECLFKELREVGYSPTTEFVLFDIEEKEKKYFLGCHSEKLAVAFALINTGANDIICVIKNLRIW